MFRTIPIALLVMLAALMTACDQSPGNGENSNSANPAASIEQTPEPIDLAGFKERINQASANNNILVIDFWATWCAPCKAMFDDIHNLGDPDKVGSFANNVEVVSVSTDGDSEGGLTGAQKAGKYLQRKPYDAFADAYIVANKDVPSAFAKEYADQWGNDVVPAIFVFDQQGNIAGQFIAMSPEKTRQAVADTIFDLTTGDPATAGENADTVATDPEDLPEDLGTNENDNSSNNTNQNTNNNEGENTNDQPTTVDEFVNPGSNSN